MSRVENMVCPSCAAVHGQEHREGCRWPDTTDPALERDWQVQALFRELQRERRRALFFLNLVVEHHGVPAEPRVVGESCPVCLRAEARYDEATA